MKLFSISGLKCTEQNIIEHKLGDMFNATLLEDSLDGDDRDSIQIMISGREDNLFDFNTLYTASLVAGLEEEDDDTARYKVNSLSVDIDRKDSYNLSLLRRNHPDNPNDKRYEEITISNLTPNPELLTIKAGDTVIFEVKPNRELD